MFLKNFFDEPTDVGDCRLPQSRARADYRGVLNWELQRVARPGQPADNEPCSEYTPRGQVWITRLGSYTRVILVAGDGESAASPYISTQRWA